MRMSDLIARRSFMGEQQLSWDGTDETGERAAPGVCLAELEIGTQHSTRRLLIMR